MIDGWCIFIFLVGTIAFFCAANSQNGFLTLYYLYVIKIFIWYDTDDLKENANRTRISIKRPVPYRNGGSRINHWIYWFIPRNPLFDKLNTHNYVLATNNTKARDSFHHIYLEQTYLRALCNIVTKLTAQFVLDINKITIQLRHEIIIQIGS